MIVEKRLKKILLLLGCVVMLFPALALASGSGGGGGGGGAATVQTLGQLAQNLTNSFSGIAKLITAGSYLAGGAFAVGAIMKFKQHKDNPTQIPIGTPIALLFIAAALMFLPTVYSSAGKTVFGSGKQGSITGTSL